MRIAYRQDDVVFEKRRLFLADLIGYKLQRDIDANKKITNLSGDRKYLSAIVNVARGSSSATGVTVDRVLDGLKTALALEIFSFKVNGIDPFKMLDEQLKQPEFTVEVFMNPLYFSSAIALKQAVMPGFRRKPIDEEFIKERMKREGNAWAYSFERGIKDYISLEKCEKKILEE
jgi:hypothetical protein